MKRFKNKKLATLIIAFLMVFVLAGAFAAFQRVLLLDARVNLFAPMVEIVWQDVELYAGPPMWSEDNPLGIGVPSAADRFEARTWPAVPPQVFARGTGTVLGHGPIDYFVTHSDETVYALRIAEAHAWWHLSHPATDQHPRAGMLPVDDHIEDMTLAAPIDYIYLSLGMVFDNVDQEYVFQVTMGNPSTVPLITQAPILRGYWVDESDWEIYEADGYAGTPRRINPVMGDLVEIGDPAASPHSAIIEVDYSDLEGVVLQPGALETALIRFSAPAENWIEFFDTYAGSFFLDNHFFESVVAYYAIEVPAVIYAGS